MGEKIDNYVNSQPGPYIFKINGQCHHFMNGCQSSLDGDIVRELIVMLDSSNELVRHRLHGNDFPSFKLCLTGKRNGDSRQFDDPSSNDVCVILKIFTGSLNCIPNLYLFSILSYFLMVRMVTILKFHSQTMSEKLLQNIKKGQ
uniref:Uncharacterized protein n=1 Tax=Salix viminalis TaxID=40686 RepID=A0A6N2K3U1_SALVM